VTGPSPWCTFCANGLHALCVGPCTCAERDHDPDVDTAAAMRLYQRPDLRHLPAEERATQWRRSTAHEARKGNR
jgi:hypothetical protein